MAAESNTTTLTNDELSALSERLCAHSQDITNAARNDIASDLLLAATALRRMTAQDRTLRREIARVAACTDRKNRKTGARLLEIIGVDGGC